MRAPALAIALSAFVPGGLAAQACLGMPSSDGQIGVAATGTAVDDDFELGGEFHVDVTGPASFRVEYGNGHDDGVGRTSAALGSYELYLLDPNICGVAGVSYTNWGWSSLFGDFDNDGDPDFVLQGINMQGAVTKVFRNDRNTPNQPPSIPG